MPSIRSFQSLRNENGLVMLEPSVYSNDELQGYHDNEDVADDNDVFLESHDDDALLPQSAKKHRHRNRRRNIPTLFSRCVSLSPSESSSSISTTDVVESDLGTIKHINKHSCTYRAKRTLGIVLSNVIVSVIIICGTIAICVSLGLYALLKVEPSPVIDKSVSAFTIPNHNATLRQDALDQAQSKLREMLRNWNNNGRKKRDVDPLKDWMDTPYNRLPMNHFRAKRQVDPNFYEEGITQAYRKQKIQIVYVAKGTSDEGPEHDDNIFTSKRLQEIHDIEMRIMTHPRFPDFCHKSYSKIKEDPNLQMIGGCVPINSLLTYFYPSIANGLIHYDGLGPGLENIGRTLQLAMTRDTFYWYVDDHITAADRRSKILRSEIHFGVPLRGYTGPRDRPEEQAAEYREMMVEMIGLLKEASTPNVRVLYGGTEVFDYEVDEIFWGDVRMALITLGCIMVAMFILTSFSVYLTIIGIIAIVLSFPLAFFFYRVVFNLVKLGLLNGAAAFVIIGIGVDDVFVFINTFRQAGHLGNHGDRLAHTVTTAGVATFFTSFTTAAAFAANVASAIPAVHEFGLFMSLIVAGCWVTVTLVMPSALNLWVKWRCAVCEHGCYSCCTCCASSSRRELPADIQAFIQGDSHANLQSTNQMAVSPVMMSAEQSGAADVPMLSMDEGIAAGWTVYLGMLNQAVHTTPSSGLDDPMLALEQELSASISHDSAVDEGCGFTHALQVAVYYYIARPVIKARWAILVVFLLLLGTSGYIVSRLAPSSTPPQLFRADNNLQMLTDLTANISDTVAAIRCDECSGFYKEGSVTQPPPPPPTLAPTIPPTTTPTSTQSNTKRSTIATTTLLTPTTSVPTKAPTTIKSTTMLSSATTLSHFPTTSTTESNDAAGKKTTTTTDSGLQTTKSGSQTLAPTPATLTPTPDKPSIPSKATSTKPTTTPSEKTTEKTTTLAATTTTAAATTITATTTTTAAAITPTVTTRRTTTAVAKPTADITPAPATPVPQRPSKPLTSRGPLSTPPSPDATYDPCAGGRCDDLKDRPAAFAEGVPVYVVFGLMGMDRSNVSGQHVLTEDKGELIYDEMFQAALSPAHIAANPVVLRDLCRLCKLIAANTELVQPNASQCLPVGIPAAINQYILSIPECKDLPTNQIIAGRSPPAKAKAGMLPNNTILWLAFAFESTTKKGQAYFEAYNQYQKWEAFMDELRSNAIGVDSPLRNMYQTSDFWKNVMMEVVAVSSAIYGLVFSLIICVAAVAIFTGHFVLLFIVVITIVGAIGLVLSIFWLAGWQLGAVEALSLSILVGSSVDYCMHLVEGYILAGASLPAHRLHGRDPSALRQWRAGAALSHIGVSIISSALTTVVAAIPLTQTVIKPFAKFGEIVAINTSVSIFYTLTACTAFLAIFAPAKYRISVKSVGIAFAVTCAVVFVFVMVLFGVSKMGYAIPGPSGDNLFPVG